MTSAIEAYENAPLYQKLHRLQNVAGMLDPTAPPLELLRSLAVIEEMLPSSMRSAARIANEQGKSWAEIGEVLGITRQTAWGRFK